MDTTQHRVAPTAGEGRPTTGTAVDWGRGMALGAANAARAYEEHLVPGLFRPSAAALLELVPPQPRDRVLDVGAGTGIVALLAVQRLGRDGTVSAIDVNPGMLAVARSLAGAERVDWRQGDASDLPYGDASIDLVYCQHVLQFLSDRGKALREMRRVLAPGGRLGVAVWGAVERSPGYLSLSARLEQHVGPEAGTAVRQAPFALSSAEQLAELIEAAGFRDVEVRSVDILARFSSAADFLAGTLPLTAAVVPSAATMSGSQIRALTEEVTTDLRPYHRGGRLRFPIAANLAVGVAD